MYKMIVLGNGTEWCQKTTYVLAKLSEKYINGLHFDRKELNFISKVYFSRKIPGVFKVLIRPILYKNILKMLHMLEGNKYCIIIYDWNPIGGEYKLLEKIRDRFPAVKLVYVFTNVIRRTAANENEYLLYLNDWYDLVFAFDPCDANKYGFGYSPLIYDAEPISDMKNGGPINEKVYYLGHAKDRLNELHKCYERLVSLGIDVDFTISSVPDDLKKYPNDITYNKLVHYQEAVDKIQQSTCLLDIIQDNSSGLTIKTCEAVCYNKKLITTNKHVKEYSFYNPENILIIKDSTDIKREFFDNKSKVDYASEGRDCFSAYTFISRIEKNLHISIERHKK